MTFTKGRAKLLSLLLFELLLFLIGISLPVYFLSPLELAYNQKRANTAFSTDVKKNNPVPNNSTAEDSLCELTEHKNMDLIERLNSIPTDFTNIEICDIDSTLLSPDKKRQIIFAYAGISPSLLYYSDTKGQNIRWIGIGWEASWSPTGRYISYLYSNSDAGPWKISVFDTETKKEVELIENTERKDCNYGYSNIIWQKDEAAILAEYTRDIKNCPSLPTESGETIFYLNN